MTESNLRSKLRTGYFVFVALIAIKAVEYFVSRYIPKGALLYLALLAFAGAWPILYYFMHVSQVRVSGRRNHG